MAAPSPKTKANGNKQEVSDRSFYYSDLISLLPENKNELFCAQMLYYAKKNSRIFLDPKKALKYRELDSLVVDKGAYKEMVDPKTPMGKGGEANYFSADWKALPIYLHLKNIAKANIERTFKQFEVNLTDAYAKNRKMRDTYKIQSQHLLRRIINEYNKNAGLPEVANSQDPYKWIESLETEAQGKEQSEGKNTGSIDSVVGWISAIKNRIEDDMDLALYNELIYKEDYAIAFELGIKHYLIDYNKWSIKSEKFLDDIMHFNKACGAWYTDLMTGRPQIEYLIPERLWTSPYREKDGSDLMYYFTEYNITWGDFMKQIGVALSDQQLKNVFEYQKTQGTINGFQGVEWQGRYTKASDTAMVRIGRMSFLTQELHVNMDNVEPTFPNYYQAPNSWDAISDPEKVREKIADNKIYNVWYSFYYIPPTQNSISNADYAWQSQMIFNIEKNQDQFRFGENGRYSKPPLVIYDNSVQASFSDVVEGYKSKMDFLWQKYQNAMINDIDAVGINEDFIGSMLNAVDESNHLNNGNAQEGRPNGGNGQDAFVEMWKMIKQGNVGFLKMTDKNGNPIVDPSKFIVRIQNGGLEKAESIIKQILIQYELLTKSLSFNDATEGFNIKPRTPVEGIQAAVESSNQARWFIEKTYEEFLKMNAERIIQYILMIANEPQKYGYHERWDEFKTIVGEANGLMVEGIKDIPAETVGFTVNYVDNASKREFITQLALQYAGRKELDEEFVYLMLGVDNWKYAFALMRMGLNKKKKEQAQKEELEFQRQQQLQQGQLQIAMALQQVKTQGSLQEIQAQTQSAAMLQQQLDELKRTSQMLLKEQTTQGRIQEQNNKAALEAQLQSQQPFENLKVPPANPG